MERAEDAVALRRDDVPPVPAGERWAVDIERRSEAHEQQTEKLVGDGVNLVLRRGFAPSIPAVGEPSPIAAWT